MCMKKLDCAYIHIFLTRNNDDGNAEGSDRITLMLSHNSPFLYQYNECCPYGIHKLFLHPVLRILLT
jgi:hypothetical protein